MRTVFVTDPPTTVEDWLAERRALGQDRFDEVWEGEYRVAPAATGGHADVQAQLIVVLRPVATRAGLITRGPCNIGRVDDYRVPDLAFFRAREALTWYPSAAIVGEVVSPGDDSLRKSGFYFRSGVEELLIADPDARTIEWFEREPHGFRPAAGSSILGLTSVDLAAAIDWPG